jgi:formamidopyrimidine-DNA glycosylase
MPELPDLELIRDFLQQNIRDVPIREVEVLEPLVLRCSAQGLVQDLVEKTFTEIRRRGKFLVFDLDGDAHLIFHLMLVGRFQYCGVSEKPRAGLCLRLVFSNGHDLRYYDRKRMGRVYWIQGSDYSSIPQFAQQGPEATDPTRDFENFRKRIRRHPGMIKNILTNQRFLAGIGNAYADEILFAAGILPFRRRTSLTPEELIKLHHAIKRVLSWAKKELRHRVGADIYQEGRGFLKVHGKGGQACPVCGGKISEVKANRRRTNFCRVCQQ